MGVLDELGRRAAKVGQNVAGEAKKLTETARLNDQIKDAERSLEQLLLKLGLACYAELKETGGESPHNPLLGEITACYERIDSLKTEEQILRGVRRCADCNGEIALSAGFCPHCGTAQPAPKLPQKADSKFCAGCGAAMALDAKFCLNCGEKAE